MDGLRSTPQYRFSRGISEFKEEGYDATVSKLSDNLICMNAGDILDKKQITKNICINALSYLMFLKRKRAGDVKARGCADGRPQREYISKEEDSSHTVSINALFISCAMDAMKGRMVVTCNIPGAFLQGD